MDSILVRDLARNPLKRDQYLSSALILMCSIAFFSMLFVIVTSFYIEDNKEVFNYIVLISFGIIFQVSLIIDYDFQSKLNAKYSSIAKTLAMFFSSLFKLYLIYIESDVFYFALSYAVDYFFIALFLLFSQIYHETYFKIRSYSPEIAVSLMKSSWPMILSALAVSLYMRIDQLMIKAMLGSHELGLYAAASKIFEGWLIIPHVLSVSILPLIVKIKVSSNYLRNISIIFSLFFWSSVLVALLTTFLNERIVFFVFGEDYKGSELVLVFLMWSCCFSALGSISARYLTIENMEKKIAVRTLSGLVINFILNIIMIPNYGITGAAFATFLTMFFSNYVINYFDRNLRQLVYITNRAITFSWVKYEK